MQQIVKRFPGVLANDHVGFDLRQGEVHALLGENGAGKSTLMNILGGLYRPESGTILVKNQPVQLNSPRDAIRVGIGMVHQHFMLVPSQTVTENILLGLDKPNFFLDLKEYDRVVTSLGERFGLHVDPKAKIWQLSVGEQQRVEILKMLYRGADVLIMDEPTAVLAPLEIEGLFKTLKTMVASGKSIIFISHKLQEVMEIADRVSVLSRGKVTAQGVPAQGISRQELARLMVGRDVLFQLERKPQLPGEVLLSVETLHALNDQGLPALRGLSLNVCAGEIVGLAGVAGNGQRELAQVITCLRKSTSGSVRLKDRVITDCSAGEAIKRGLAHIPEDRTHVGTAPNLSIIDNVIMKRYRQAPIARGWMLDTIAAKRFANDLKQGYDIVVPTVETPARLLSGGNLQRVILAREISGNPAVMVAVQPTRGLDVGAIEGVHRLLLAQREEGAAILLISEELEELLSLSDRIYVIYEGQIMGEVRAERMDEKTILDLLGQMMTGTPLDSIQRSNETVGGKDEHA
jgi:simple sugar transport system ATP-binding protein